MKNLQWKTDQVKGRVSKINQVKVHVSKNDLLQCIRIAVDHFVKRTPSLDIFETRISIPYRFFIGGIALILDPIGQTFLRDTGPKWDTTNYIALVCQWNRNFQACYRYVLFNNLKLAVPKMGQMSEVGTFPKCKMVLVLHFYYHPCLHNKKKGVVKLRNCSQYGTDVLKWDIPITLYFIL